MTWVVMIAVGLGSFAFRLGPLLLFERVTLGDRGNRLIRHAGTAALTALIAVSARHSASGTATVPALAAVAVALVVASRGASMLRVLVLGGAAYAVVVVCVGLLSR